MSRYRYDNYEKYFVIRDLIRLLNVKKLISDNFKDPQKKFRQLVASYGFNSKFRQYINQMSNNYFLDPLMSSGITFGPILTIHHHKTLNFQWVKEVPHHILDDWEGKMKSSQYQNLSQADILR